MKVTIKEIESGWLIHYSVYYLKSSKEPYTMEYVKQYEADKAFVYDFDNEYKQTWEKLVNFLMEQFNIKDKMDKK